MNKQLPTNRHALKVLIAKTGVVAIGTCIVVTLVFRVIGIGIRIENVFLFAMWLLIPGMWIGWTLYMQSQWDKTTYTLTADSVIVAKRGWTSVVKQMYRYDSILSVTVRQDWAGTRHNYGDIQLEIPRLSKQVALRYISEPEKQVVELKALVAQHGRESAIT